MTRVQLLHDLTRLCENAVKDMVFPLQVQMGDTKERKRAPTVYKMRLPESKSYEKYAPYIVVQLISSRHSQKEGGQPLYMADVRFIFCVYCDDRQEGSIMLLNIMDRVQEKLLKSVTVGGSFSLNVHEPLESLIYPDDTTPFYMGEMVGTFMLPPIEREVNFDELFQTGGNCRQSKTGKPRN